MEEKKNFLTLSETLRHNFWKSKKLSTFCSSCFSNAVYTAFIHNERNHIASLITPIKYVFFLEEKKRNIGRFLFNQKVGFEFLTTSSSETKNVFQNFQKDRLREVPSLSSWIVEGAKRERAWKSPHARKGDTRHPTASHLSRVGWFHARSRFAPSTIPEDKWGTTRSLQKEDNLARYNQIFGTFFPEVFFPFNFAPGISRIIVWMVRIFVLRPRWHFMDDLLSVYIKKKKRFYIFSLHFREVPWIFRYMVWIQVYSLQLVVVIFHWYIR